MMQVAQLISDVLGQDVPIRIVAYDGSKAGPDSSEVALRILSPRALARLVTAPGTLGLARAYVTGEIEVEGDVYDVLDAMADVTLHDLSRAEQVQLVRKLFPVWLRHRQPPPPLEYRPPGRLHSKSRDSKAISHHYDVSNRFYEWVLGPSMAYTCAVYPRKDATLEEAQATKF
jgi:cyclopropane-fatty-acyl-phospholipid synthase